MTLVLHLQRKSSVSQIYFEAALNYIINVRIIARKFDTLHHQDIWSLQRVFYVIHTESSEALSRN